MKMIIHMSFYSDRRESRLFNYQRGIDAKEAGNNEKAEQYFQRSVTITSNMIAKVINSLKLLNIHYMISPYEADSQLSFLSKNDLIDVVITEDSDALIYGCQHVLYKLDRAGNCQEILRKNLGSNSSEFSFLKWKNDQFRLFCCLVGSDYCPNIRNIGIKTSYKYVSQFKTFDIVLNNLKQKFEIDDPYILSLWKAIMTFKYQTIFNPLTWKLEHLNPITAEDAKIYEDLCHKTNSMVNYDFLGKMFDDQIAIQLSRGYIMTDSINLNSTNLNISNNNQNQNIWSFRNDNSMQQVVDNIKYDIMTDLSDIPFQDDPPPLQQQHQSQTQQRQEIFHFVSELVNNDIFETLHRKKQRKNTISTLSNSQHTLHESDMDLQQDFFDCDNGIDVYHEEIQNRNDPIWFISESQSQVPLRQPQQIESQHLIQPKWNDFLEEFHSDDINLPLFVTKEEFLQQFQDPELEFNLTTTLTNS